MKFQHRMESGLLLDAVVRPSTASPSSLSAFDDKEKSLVFTFSTVSGGSTLSVKVFSVRVFLNENLHLGCGFIADGGCGRKNSQWPRGFPGQRPLTLKVFSLIVNVANHFY